MIDQYAITPPPELCGRWYDESPYDDELGLVKHVATQAARWGADQQLLACGKYLEQRAAWEEEDVTEMYNYLRPKSPSLKEQALEALKHAPGPDYPNPITLLTADEHDLIRRALEQLDD